MSLQSQTPAGSRLRLLVPLAVVPALVALALAPIGQGVLRAAGQAQLHPPDLAVLASLTPAIKVHLAAALAALVLGAVLMAVRKGARFHRIAGWTWVGLVGLTAGSTLFITSLNHGKWSLLHLFTGWTLIVLPLAVLAARRRQIVRHRRNMMGLFYGGFAVNLLIAFIPGRALWRMLLG